MREKLLSLLDERLAAVVDLLEAARREGRLFDGMTSAATDHPKPIGPATDAVAEMDKAIRHDRIRRKRALDGER